MWYRPDNEEFLQTPAVLVYPDRIEENIRRMITIAGRADRLRPHVKTHKTAEITQLQIQHGIRKFKCATLAEAEMVASCGGTDILLAYPLLGPAVNRYFRIREAYPDLQLAVTLDSGAAFGTLVKEARLRHEQVAVFVDLDNGMHRTGIPPGEAMDLVTKITNEMSLSLAGLHIYDGHIHEPKLRKRKAHCEKDFESVLGLISRMEAEGIAPGELACGGTPTFPVHALDERRTLCPGTTLLWDAGYSNSYPDLDFLHAMTLAGRVVSKPEGDLCIDLGHKAVASEMPPPRLHFMGLEVSEVKHHNEEHLVVASPQSDRLHIGDLVYALPTHVCPTMALYDMVLVVENGQITNRWRVVARDRSYGI